MNYFNTIKYDTGGEGAVHFQPILSSDEKQMFLAIQFYKLYPDKRKCISCDQTFDIDGIDQLIEQLQVAKRNILKYNAGQSTTNDPQDYCWEHQYKEFRDRYDKVKSSDMMNLFG